MLTDLQSKVHTLSSLLRDKTRKRKRSESDNSTFTSLSSSPHVPASSASSSPSSLASRSSLAESSHFLLPQPPLPPVAAQTTPQRSTFSNVHTATSTASDLLPFRLLDVSSSLPVWSQFAAAWSNAPCFSFSLLYSSKHSKNLQVHTSFFTVNTWTLTAHWLISIACSFLYETRFPQVLDAEDFTFLPHQCTAQGLCVAWTHEDVFYIPLVDDRAKSVGEDSMVVTLSEVPLHERYASPFMRSLFPLR